MPGFRLCILVLACAATWLALGAARGHCQSPSGPTAPSGAATAEPLAPSPPSAPDDSKATNEPQVVEVRVVGNRATSLSKIHGVLSTRAGRPFDQGALENDVRKLAAKGWFLDVKTLREDAPGGVIIIFQVAERPTLEYVKYVGNEKIYTKTLAKQTELKRGDALDPYAVEDGRRKMEEFYHGKGYNNVKITILEGTKPKDRGAVYQIREGEREKVWSVKFVGNTIASDSRLKTQVQSKPPIAWFFRGYVERKKIDEDVERLTAYYRSLGFFRARVSRELEFNEARNWLTVTFYINEGPRYRIRNVTLIGNTKFTNEQLSEHLQLKSGEFFDQAKSTKDLNTMKDIYGGVGYIYADVLPEPRLLEEPGQLDLVYNVSEGDRYRIGRINIRIQGENAHTRHNTVRTRMSIRPGDIADIRELRKSERRLKASGLFLADPARGIAPKIVFVPPDENEASLASQPDPPENIRGQSPDPPSRDRRIDVDLWAVPDPNAKESPVEQAQPVQQNGASLRRPAMPHVTACMWSRMPVSGPLAPAPVAFAPEAARAAAGARYAPAGAMFPPHSMSVTQ